MDNIFLPGNENIVHFLINAWACLCQFIFFHQSFICSRGWHSNLYLNQASADMRDSVTTSVTLHGLCHPECKGDSSSNCSPCPHRWTDYKQTPKWPQVCAWQVCTQTYAKNFSPTLTCLQYMTQDRSTCQNCGLNPPNHFLVILPCPSFNLKSLWSHCVVSHNRRAPGERWAGGTWCRCCASGQCTLTMMTIVMKTMTKMMIQKNDVSTTSKERLTSIY